MGTSGEDTVPLIVVMLYVCIATNAGGVPHLLVDTQQCESTNERIDG